MFSAFANLKDRAVESSAKGLINRKIEKFGVVTALTLNSSQKTLSIEAELKGETAPVGIRIGAYELVQRDGGVFIVVRQAEASREWITTALNEFVVGKEFKLPEQARMAL